MDFIKAHGLGNDFIILSDMDNTLDISPRDAVRLCSRRTGIGADGLMLARPAADADAYMHLYNSDGSVAEMCGNGIRCFAKYLYHTGIAKKPLLRIATPAGIKEARLTIDDGDNVTAVRIDMGAPLLSRRDVPMTGEGSCQLITIPIEANDLTCTALNTGVPHLVVFENGFTEQQVCHYGPILERHPLFPAGINVNFAQILPDGSISVRTWERGCGRTLACGTGSCACLVAAALAGYTGRSATIRLALGELSIEWAKDGHIFMAGPAELSFRGSI